MKLSEEMAVRLHRMMWSDMQKELGDNPSGKERVEYKSKWITKHFPGEPIASSCWLCEYASLCQEPGDCRHYCRYCPIRWPGGTCCPSEGGVHYETAPISDILALPARNENIKDELDKVALVRSYYQYREGPLSMASGIPGSFDIKDHVKAIQEKAVEEYFEKTPGAKLATMDVDQAFRQYADEQKEPLKREIDRLSKQIKIIYDNGFSDGQDHERKRIMDKIGEMLNHDIS